FFFFFFFQAEDGIRDLTVTGVQTCALPISCRWILPTTWSSLSFSSTSVLTRLSEGSSDTVTLASDEPIRSTDRPRALKRAKTSRSEERRVGKECRYQWGHEQ